MARKNRKISQSDIYHVILRGVNRQRIFEESEDYNTLYRIMLFVRDYDTQRQAVSEPNYFLYAYCIMDNHIHLLIQPNKQEMGKIITRISTTYAIYFNQKYDRVGHLFQDRYRSEPVEDKDYFITLLEYIHMNPVEAGICRHPSQYPFSSFNELTTKQKTERGQSPFGDYKKNTNLCAFPESISLSEITPLVIIEILQQMDEVLPIKGVVEKLQYMVQNNDNKICQMIRVRLNWQTAQEKDQAIVKVLLDITNTSSISDFQQLDKRTTRNALALMKASGVAEERLSRLTGIPRGIIRGAASA